MQPVAVVYSLIPDDTFIYVGAVTDAQVAVLRKHAGIVFNENNTDEHSYEAVDEVLQTLTKYDVYEIGRIHLNREVFFIGFVL